MIGGVGGLLAFKQSFFKWFFVRGRSLLFILFHFKITIFVCWVWGSVCLSLVSFHFQVHHLGVYSLDISSSFSLSDVVISKFVFFSFLSVVV